MFHLLFQFSYRTIVVERSSARVFAQSGRLEIFLNIIYHPHEFVFFFFIDRAPPEIYPFPLHDAFPIRNRRGHRSVAGEKPPFRPTRLGGVCAARASGFKETNRDRRRKTADLYRRHWLPARPALERGG